MVQSRFSFILQALSLAALVSGRKFTVVNKCAFTIWPALYTDVTGPNAGQAIPEQPTGWEAPAGHSVTFTVPDTWASARLWGRTECDFSKEGAVACSSGSCNGGLLCDPHTGTGVPPVTVGEWTLGKDGPEGHPDNYDVSLVDGFNLPMTITPTGGCMAPDCPADLNANCPKELALVSPATGKTVGCKSDCTANLDDNAADSPSCCSGSHDKPETCPPSGVPHYDHFKGPCPNSYAYAYDESSKTALWTCEVTKKADYTVTFCG